MARVNMTVARVGKLNKASAGKSERHNERKNETYTNLNVDTERIKYNVSYKSPGDMTYNEYFDKLIEEEKISTRGLKEDATHFNEIIIDVNTEYFEEHGGYEFAKEFYAEAYRFCCNLYGEEEIVSAVMHADEINKEVSERLGKPVYHYHLHVVAIPTVEKEIKWSARCKDENLRGKVRKVIHQVSHSKKWRSVPAIDENGRPKKNKNGKPIYEKSYSILQDKLFEHMKAAGFTDFTRGVKGSTAEHLTCLQYQIEKDKERLSKTENEIIETKEKLSEEKIKYENNHNDFMNFHEIESAGKKHFTGYYTVPAEEFEKMRSLAIKEIASNGEIFKLKETITEYKRRNRDLYDRLDYVNSKLHKLEEAYNELLEFAKPFLEATKKFPNLVKEFLESISTKIENRKEQKDKRIQPENRECR